MLFRSMAVRPFALYAAGGGVADRSLARRYMQPRIETAMRETDHHKTKRLYVAGQEPTSSVATGSKKQHMKEIEQVRFLSSCLWAWLMRRLQFLDQAFDLSKHTQTHGSQAAH